MSNKKLIHFITFLRDLMQVIFTILLKSDIKRSNLKNPSSIIRSRINHRKKKCVKHIYLTKNTIELV